MYKKSVVKEIVVRWISLSNNCLDKVCLSAVLHMKSAQPMIGLSTQKSVMYYSELFGITQYASVSHRAALACLRTWAPPIVQVFSAVITQHNTEIKSSKYPCPGELLPSEGHIWVATAS